MDKDIRKLIGITTIVKVEDNTSHKVIYGDKYCISRFQKDQGNQIDLSSLDQNWGNKWQSFGNEWNEERQNYRFLYNSFRLFYYSFEQLRFNKIGCINEAFNDKKIMLHFNELTAVSLYGMYHHGKKCIDLMEALKLIDATLGNWVFCSKFSETRNKLIEHNYNPRGLNLHLDPLIWSLISTNSLMEISIHNNMERAYDAHVDYYEDYYMLEKIIVGTVKQF